MIGSQKQTPPLVQPYECLKPEPVGKPGLQETESPLKSSGTPIFASLKTDRS